ETCLRTQYCRAVSPRALRQQQVCLSLFVGFDGIRDSTARIRIAAFFREHANSWPGPLLRRFTQDVNKAAPDVRAFDCPLLRGSNRPASIAVWKAQDVIVKSGRQRWRR